MKIWQYNTTPIDSLRQECIDQVKSKIPSGYSYTLLSDKIELYPLEGINDRAKSDGLRYKILKDNSDDCWLDTDVKIIKWWEPAEKGIVYVNSSFSVIFANGASIFNELVEEYFSQEMKERLIGYIYNFFQKRKDSYRLIPDGYFKHYAFSYIPKGSWILLGNNEYSFRKKDDGSIVFNHDKNFDF
jgi:hypothetical protein